MNYPMTPQEKDFWCWAAVTQSVVKFFDRNSTEKQCDVAKRVFPYEDCCGDGDAGNVPSELQDSLGNYQRFEQMLDQQLPFEIVREFVRAHYPVCVRIGWQQGGGHFVVITGYAISKSGEPFVTIADPQLESGSWRFEEFAEAYYGIGRWTHTYLVKVKDEVA